MCSWLSLIGRGLNQDGLGKKNGWNSICGFEGTYPFEDWKTFQSFFYRKKYCANYINNLKWTKNSKKLLTLLPGYTIIYLASRMRHKQHGRNNIAFGVWLSLARAPGLGPGGRRFESCHPDFLLKRKNPCGCSSVVEHQPSKLDMWVRFPSPAFSMLYTEYVFVAQLDRATAF